MKIKDRLIERRKYIRLKTPIPLTYIISDAGKVHSSVTKDISADGLRFETREKDLKEGVIIELKLEIPGATSSIHAKGKIMWQKPLSLEDNAPFDVGIEFTEIEETIRTHS